MISFHIMIIINLISISTLIFGQLSKNYDEKIHFTDDEYYFELNSECKTTYNTLGICKRANDCPKERIKLTRHDICYFDQNDPIVCCEKDIKGFPILAPINWEQNHGIQSDKLVKISPNLQDTTSSTTDNSIPSLSTASDSLDDPFFGKNEKIYNGRIIRSQRLADKYCTTPKDLNSKTGNTLFVGGSLAKAQENPQMAAIGWKTFGDEIDWKCGGSLISHNFVITAAHCTSDRGQPPAVIRVGDLNLLKNDVIAQNFNITNIYVHPEYRRRLMYHDIALLEIAPNATFNQNVNPACLWTFPDVPVPRLVAMGYGTDAFAGKKTNELYEGNLTHVSNDKCRKDFGTSFQIPNGIIESQVCAQDLNGVADTCQGDSGGPLLFRSGQGIFSKQHLIGITSFGESCAGPTPGVYTRISSYIDWIESIVWPSGQI